MSYTLSDFTTLLTYGFLYLAVISLWLPKLKKHAIWLPLLIIAMIFGLISHHLKPLSILFIAVLGIATYLLADNRRPIWLRSIAAIVLLIIAISLETHFAPGFDNLRVLDKVQISSDAIPFTLYLNFDKTVVGIFILALLHPLVSTRTEWINLLKATLPRACLIIIVIASTSFAFGFIHFDPKLSHHLLIWSTTNLLFVCFAEEALFRGFIQKYLCKMLNQFPTGNIAAIMASSILFGLAHYTGGTKYIVLATIAGLGYGWIYFRVKRIEASIISHFLLNLVHFLLFTYPALA